MKKENRSLLRRDGLSKLCALKDAKDVQKFFFEEIEGCRSPNKSSCCVWTASAAATSVAADSSTTSVPNVSDQDSNYLVREL